MTQNLKWRKGYIITFLTGPSEDAVALCYVNELQQRGPPTSLGSLVLRLSLLPSNKGFLNFSLDLLHLGLRM